MEKSSGNLPDCVNEKFATAGQIHRKFIGKTSRNCQ
jgi:hypothetical protein